MSVPPPEAVARYRAFWEELSPASTESLRAIAMPSMRFRDPFQEIEGVDRVVAMLDRMFETLENPAFRVRREAVGEGCAFFAWQFEAGLRGRALRIDGASEITFDGSGLVLAHLDHFDAAMQVYARLPLLGRVLHLVRARIGAHA